jgi:dephospho-CoA kinase
VLRVGLTGGLASGKSTLAALLAGHGAAVRDADELVAGLYGPGGAGAGLVAELFGAEMLDAGGAVERRRLGALVLRDPARRRRLETAVHPLVRAEIARWFAGLEALTPPPDVAVLEAALLVETGSWRDYHRLVVVTAPVELRRARALAAGWPADAVAKVLEAQASDAEREAVADYLVRNDGDSDELVASADRLWAALSDDAARLAAGRAGEFRLPPP